MAANTIKDININVSKILMDRENPRHDLINDQEEIINWHVITLGEKLLQLMRSIAGNGLSDIDKILLTPSKNGHIVKEGNRRVVALKLLQNPSLCSNSFFRRKIESVTVSENFTFNIDCISCDDRYRILWMMGLKHLGQQNGVGTSTWGAAEKNRHNQDYTGQARYWRSAYFIEYALQNNIITDQQAIRLNEKITNLDRLIPSAEFKKALGVSYKGSQVFVSQEKSLHDRILGVLLERFSQPKFNVAEIYNSDNKLQFITGILDKVRLLNASPPTVLAPSAGGENLVSKSNPEKKSASPLKIENSKITDFYPEPKVRKEPNPAHRDKLFIGSISIPSSHSKCSKLYRQIDSLSLKNHGLVVACAARALVDITCQAYIEQFSVVSDDPKRNNFGQSTLAAMIKLTAGHLLSNNKIKKDFFNILNSGDAANPQSFLHPQAFHAYIHGKHEISMTNLKEAWDRCYETLLRAAWSHIKEKQE